MGKASRLGRVGLRRVNWVRIDLTGPQPRAEVTGVGQHRPVTRTIPLSVARELSATGIPTFVRRRTETDPELVEAG